MHDTLRRTHNGGPETIFHTEPRDWPELERHPDDVLIGRTARMPGRHWREQRVRSDNPWAVRLFGYALLLVVIVAVGVLAWPQ